MNFKKTKTLRDNKLTYNESELNTLGYSLLKRGKSIESVKIFRLALEIYPRSANLYDSLGEVYMINGDNENAIVKVTQFGFDFKFPGN